MTCPDCKSEEVIKDSGGTFCKKCGLELDEVNIHTGGPVSKADRLELTLLPEIEFIVKPKMELYAFKIGLKKKRLVDDWQKLYGFKLKSDLLPGHLKEKVIDYIKKALKNHIQELVEAQSRFEKNWKKISGKYLAEVENIMDYKWDSQKYECYISLASKGGIHNSSHNYIIINYRWKENSSYIIAHELYHIIFRKYVTRFFKEKYDDFDEYLSEIVVNFVLLDNEKIKDLFPKIKFSLDIYPERIRKIAKKIHPIWKSSSNFKEFMINSYKEFEIEKTWVSY